MRNLFNSLLGSFYSTLKQKTMATLYDKKIVISGKTIEVYKYSKMQVYGFTAFAMVTK